MDEVDSIHVATERLMGSMGDTPEMVRQARILALVCFSSPFYYRFSFLVSILSTQ